MIFWLIAAALALLAGAFIAYAAFATSTSAGDPATAAANVFVHTEHESELDRQWAAGEIDTAQHRELVAETRRKLLAERAEPARTGDRGGRWLIGICAVVLPLLAVVLYWRMGAAPDVAIADALAHSTDTASALAPRIRARLAQRPDNASYWMLLGRIAQADGHFATAAHAYAQAAALLPEDAGAQAHAAQALFLAAGNRVTPAVDTALARAIALDPDNGLALELSGIAAFARDDFRAALVAWQGALRQAAADSDEAKALRAGIARAREGLGAPPEGRSIRVRVALAKGLRAEPSATVFVFVREWQGRPMPVMARRLTVAELPAEMVFTDDMALAPGRDLSSVATFELVARVSSSGTPEPSPGDPEGRRGPLTRADGDGFELLIDTPRSAASDPR